MIRFAHAIANHLGLFGFVAVMVYFAIASQETTVTIKQVFVSWGIASVLWIAHGLYQLYSYNHTHHEAHHA